MTSDLKGFFVFNISIQIKKIEYKIKRKNANCRKYNER